MKKVLIATTNPGKIREFQDLLTNRDLELITPRDLKIEIEVVEDGSTYAQNAARKALAYAAESGLITLADDSGLEVEVLDGAPGIHSARFSSLPGATDADRRAALLQALEGKSAGAGHGTRCKKKLPGPDWPAGVLLYAAAPALQAIH